MKLYLANLQGLRLCKINATNILSDEQISQIYRFADEELSKWAGFVPPADFTDGQASEQPEVVFKMHL